MEDALVSFTEIDFASHLRLSSLDMVELHNLFQETQGEGLDPSPSSTRGNK